MPVTQLVLGLVSLLLDALGGDHEKAQNLISEEAKRRANLAADAVAEARRLAGA